MHKTPVKTRPPPMVLTTPTPSPPHLRTLHKVFRDEIREGKLINDPIHGHMYLPASCMQVVDTAEFQRLRCLKQLGATYYVFPGASHNRFEHCLGVCHLATSMGDLLLDKQEWTVSDGPDRREVIQQLELVAIAGLCHDLGHGPFSHAFECWLKEDIGFKAWDHEQMSCDVLRLLVDNNQLDYSEHQLRFMESVIKGDAPQSPAAELATSPKWLFDIVHSSRNSVDVDKFDYLARDAFTVGLKTSYDFTRLMHHSRVVEDEVCFNAKEVFNIYELFHTRYSLHKQVYSHRVVRALEYMIRDAFTLADDVLQISQRAQKAQSFCTLTDEVLLAIEFSTDPQLLKARSLVSQIRRRNLYKCIGSALVSTDSRPLLSEQELILPEICARSGGALQPSDLVLDHLSLNYSMKDHNPVDAVHFFRSGSTKKYSIPRQQVSLLIPEKFEEHSLRVFLKDTADPDKLSAASKAFIEWKKDNRLDTVDPEDEELASSLLPPPVNF